MSKADTRHLALVVSDMHCGSTTGLWPPDFVAPGTDTYQPQSPTSAYIWQAWQEMQKAVEKYAAGRKYSLVVNGDMIEGVHHKSVELYTHDPGDHIAAALQCLAPLADKADRVWVTEGTECHTRTSEQALASTLGAQLLKTAHKRNEKTTAHRKLRLAMPNGGTMVVRHHIGTTSRRQLEATQLSIAINEERMQADRAGQPLPSFLCAAHRHVYGHFSDGFVGTIITPSWQNLTRHGAKVVPAAECVFGGVILDWTGGDVLPRVVPLLYQPPTDAVGVL